MTLIRIYDGEANPQQAEPLFIAKGAMLSEAQRDILAQYARMLSDNEMDDFVCDPRDILIYMSDGLGYQIEIR